MLKSCKIRINYVRLISSLFLPLTFFRIVTVLFKQVLEHPHNHTTNMTNIAIINSAIIIIIITALTIGTTNNTITSTVTVIKTT